MKNDDFEKQLQQQPLRPVPEHWRNQILQAARKVESAEPRSEGPANKSWLYQLLWPCPQAWGALAAVWVVVLFLNYAGAEKSEVSVAKATESREVMMALKQQQRFQAELMSANDTPVAEPPKFSAPQSRIESFVPINRV